MDTLRTWVLLLCGTAIASALLGALLPEEENKGAFRVLTAIVLLFALVQPLQHIRNADAWPGSALTVSLPDEQALADTAADAKLLAANRTIETAITQVLRDAGYPDVSVRVDCALVDDKIAPQRITVHGTIQADTLRALLRPYLTAHTSLLLLTED